MGWEPPPSRLGLQCVELYSCAEAGPPAGGAALMVRAARHEDLDLISATEAEAYPFPWTRGNFSDSLHSRYDFWVLADGPALVGHAVLMWSVDEVHLLNITVQPKLQGRGYGRRLMHWLFEDTRLRGARSMLLEVRPSNVLAMGLYERLGFVRIGMRKGYYPSWNNSREDALVFSRLIDHTEPESPTRIS